MINSHALYRLSYGGIYKCWRLPIFTGRFQPTIFGTTELNFCVRDGNRWTLSVINTNYLFLLLTFWVLVTRARIELALPPWEGGVLTAWPTGQFSSARAGCPAPTFSLVRHQGFEPGTPWLRVRCSTNWANGAYCALHLQNWIKNF